MILATHSDQGSGRFQIQRTLRPLLLAVSLTAALIATVVRADAPAPARSMTPLVDFFQGSWKCAGHFANGKAISATEAFTSILGGAALRESHADDPPFPYHSESVWNVDQASSGLLLTIHDNFGGIRVFSASDWHGKPIVFDAVSLLGRPSSHERFVYERMPDGSFTYEYQVLRSGQWATGDRLLCVKSGT